MIPYNENSDRLEKSLFESLHGIVAPRDIVTGATQAGRPVITGQTVFQGRAITIEDINEVFGDPDEFLSRYRRLHSEYQAAIDRGMQPGKESLLPELTKKHRMMNLRQFDRETSERLSTMFRDDVMKLGQLMRRMGAPSRRMPNSNKYRVPLMFDVDLSDIQHPVQVVLSQMMLNYDPDKLGLASMQLSASNLVTPEALEETFRNLKQAQESVISGQNFGVFGALPEPGRTKKILTFDTEMTGVFDTNQTRSLYGKIIELASDGTMNYPLEDAPFVDFAFKSPHLNSMFSVFDDSVMTLNNFIARIESNDPTSPRILSEMGEGGKNFLDEATTFLTNITDPTKVDAIAGHNILFDIEKLTRTMIYQPDFLSHSGAVEAVGKFYDRVGRTGTFAEEGGDFVIDTLAYARIYLQNQVKELTESSLPASADAAQRSKAFVDNLYSQDILARVNIGGSAAYASVENIALNTNLFELMAQEDQAEELFSKITKGSHIAETDVHLQNFIGKYIQNKSLKIRSIANQQGEAESEIGIYLRNMIVKSHAMMATTDIASVRHMHEYTREFIKSEEGIKDVKLSLRQDIDLNFTMEEGKALFGEPDSTVARPTRGVLRFDKKNQQYIFDVLSESSAQPRVVDTDLAKNLIRRVITSAAERTDTGQYVNEVQQSLSLNSGRTVNLTRNLFDEAILSTGIDQASQSRMIELLSLAGFQAAPHLAAANVPELGIDMRNIEAIRETLGSTYRVLGTQMQPKRGLFGKAKTMLADSPQDSISTGNIADRNLEEVTALGNNFRALGDVFAGVMDSRSRIFSTILANGTSSLGQAAGIAAGSLANEALTYTRYADILSEFGLSYFKSQDVIRLVDSGKPSNLPSSKIMLPMEMVQKVLEDMQIDPRRMTVGYSVAQETATSSERLNVVFEAGELLGGSRQVDGVSRSLSKIFSEKILEMMQDSNQLGSVLGSMAESMAGNITSQAAEAEIITNRAGASEGLVNSLAERIMDRGVVVGYADEQSSPIVIKALRAAGILKNNDVLLGARSRIAYDTGLEGQNVFVTTPAQVGLTPAEDIIKTGMQAQGVSVPDLDLRPSGARQIQNVNTIANAIDESGQASEIRRTYNELKTTEQSSGFLKQFYVNNKKNIRNFAIGAAAAGVGYYLYNRKKESDLYNETLETQPVSRNMNSLTTRSYSPSSQTSRQLDPLATAGVVGNLDRRRIGHTQMGNDRHSHLFGG